MTLNGRQRSASAVHGPERAASLSLGELAQEYGSDKDTAHSYAQWYDRHLGRFRDRAIRLLEIGVGGNEDPYAGGASLRMWAEYFPNAQIFGLDIHPKLGVDDDRITILCGDQGDSAFLEGVAERWGPFDVVIDDGSHLSRDVVASFRALFPHVVDGGVYVVEDLQTSYWANYNELGQGSLTTMEFLKALADGLNHAEFDVANYRPSYFDLWVEGISLYHNLAFVLKGRNDEVSNVLPPHPRPARLMDRPKQPPLLALAIAAFHLLPAWAQTAVKRLRTRL